MDYEQKIEQYMDLGLRDDEAATLDYIADQVLYRPRTTADRDELMVTASRHWGRRLTGAIHG